MAINNGGDGMKLYIDHKRDQSGKMKFMSRLVPELKKLGIKICEHIKDSDVVLGINTFRKGVSKDKARKFKHKKKRILRLDGIHLEKNKRNIWANRKVKEDAERSDAIIWQSEFCKRMWKGIMGISSKREHIIHNGANPDDYTESFKSPYKYNIIMSAKWKNSNDRLYKRLKDSYSVAAIAGFENHLSEKNAIGFWIAGDTENTYKKFPQSKNIHWLGHLPETELRKYLKMADIILNISAWSWMDNSLVEAICAGCIPITGNQGGNAEVCKKVGGVVVDIDKEIPVKYVGYKPPKINQVKVAQEIQSVLAFKPKINIEPVHIRNIAKQYYEVIRKI